MEVFAEKKNIKKMNDLKSSVETLEERIFKENILQIREQFLLSLMQGTTIESGNLYEQAGVFQIPVRNHFYNTFIFAVSDTTDIIHEQTILSYVRGKLRKDATLKCVNFMDGFDTNRHLFVVAYSQQKEMLKAFADRIQSFANGVKEDLRWNVYCGQGCIVERLELLFKSTVMADYCLTEKNGFKSKMKHRSYIVLDQIMTFFSACDIQAITGLMDDYIRKLEIEGLDRQILVEHFLVLYLQSITKECMRLGIALERFESYVPAVVTLMQKDTKGSVAAMLALTEQIIRYRSVPRTSESNHLLTMAKDYILNNLSNERLDLATVSDYVGLSRVYFCKLFHQMEGISFSAYLKKVRIEKAKQLLLTTNMKVFEVSNAVGFSHAKYFGHVFKEVVGQTPASYQKYEKTDA